MELHACPTCGSRIELALAHDGFADAHSDARCPCCGEAVVPSENPSGAIFLGAIVTGATLGLIVAAMLLLVQS